MIPARHLEPFLLYPAAARAAARDGYGRAFRHKSPLLAMNLVAKLLNQA